MFIVGERFHDAVKDWAEEFVLYEGCLDLGPEDWDMFAQQYHALYREGVKKIAKD